MAESRIRDLKKFGDTYYLTYTGYNKKDAQLCLATSRDLLHWERKGVIVPANRGNWNVKWTKSGAIVPQKDRRQILDVLAGNGCGRNRSDGFVVVARILLHWTEETPTPVLPRRAGRFDSRVVEPGPPPILTRIRIVLVYNGADDQLVYRTGIAIFDLQRSAKADLANGRAGFCAREGLGKGWAGAQCCVCRRNGETVRTDQASRQTDEFLFLLWRGGQVRRRGACEAANCRRGPVPN